MYPISGIAVRYLTQMHTVTMPACDQHCMDSKLMWSFVLYSPADLVHWSAVSLLLHHQLLLLSYHWPLHWLCHSLPPVQLVLSDTRAACQLPSPAL